MHYIQVIMVVGAEDKSMLTAIQAISSKVNELQVYFIHYISPIFLGQKIVDLLFVLIEP